VACTSVVVNSVGETIVFLLVLRMYVVIRDTAATFEVMDGITDCP
jgi:hypothetical protein